MRFSIVTGTSRGLGLALSTGYYGRAIMFSGGISSNELLRLLIDVFENYLFGGGLYLKSHPYFPEFYE